MGLAKISKSKTESDRIQEYKEIVDARLGPLFKSKEISYPPKHLTLIGIKKERLLSLYSSNDGANHQFIVSYPILAASGVLGPKMKEGDRQVPEGLYVIESLNPNSLYHLSLRVNYPNAWDKQKAQEEGRVNLGGDIMIHGRDVSIGCLAMGDEVAENLFILGTYLPKKQIAVILSPVDFRLEPDFKPISKTPSWLPELYQTIQTELANYPSP